MRYSAVFFLQTSLYVVIHWKKILLFMERPRLLIIWIAVAAFSEPESQLRYVQMYVQIGRRLCMWRAQQLKRQREQEHRKDEARELCLFCAYLLVRNTARHRQCTQGDLRRDSVQGAEPTGKYLPGCFVFTPSPTPQIFFMVMLQHQLSP